MVEHLNHLRVHHINKSACRRVLEVVVICVLTGTASVVLPAAFECKPESRTIIMEDSAGCLNDADRFQMSHGTISHPYLVELLETAQTSGNCTATSLAGSGSSIDSSSARRMLLESSTGSGSGSSSSSSSSSGALAPNINEILKELNIHRHQGSGIGNSGSTAGSTSGTTIPIEDDVVWVDNLSPYIHLHYSHTYTCDSSKHEYNEMSMLWLNGTIVSVLLLCGTDTQLTFLFFYCWDSFCLFLSLFVNQIVFQVVSKQSKYCCSVGFLTC